MTTDSPAGSPPPVGDEGAIAPSTKGWRFGFGTTLAMAMGTGTFLQGGLAALAVFIIRDLDLSRAQFGGLAFALSAVGALGAPWAGRVADAIGGRLMLVLIYAVTAASMVMLAATSTYPLALVAAAIGGVGIAASNPATNKLIGNYLRPGERGLIMGIKQAGVTGGVFLAGASLPALAVVAGWRMAIAASLALPLLGMVLVKLFVPVDVRRGREGHSRGARLPSAVWWITGNGVLVGLGQGALLNYVPLYGYEALDFEEATAGALVAVMGMVAIASRIGWGRVSERAHERAKLRTRGLGPPAYSSALLLHSALSVAATAVILVSGFTASWLLWAGAVFAGATAIAWQSVGMLGVVEATDQLQMGRASGLVQFGFLAGVSISPLVFGFVIDQTESYGLGWALALLSFAFAGLQIFVWRRVHAAKRARGEARDPGRVG